MTFSIAAALLLLNSAPEAPTLVEPAATVETPARFRAWAEVDVLAYILGPASGEPHYSLHVGFFHRALPRWRFGFGAFGGGHLPSFFTGTLDAVNGAIEANRGWRVGENGLALQAFFHFAEKGTGFYVGAYLMWLRLQLSRPGDVIDTHQLVLHPSAGFRWFPFQPYVYVGIWGGFGVMTPWFGTRVVEGSGQGYQALRFFPFGSVHVGFEL